MTEEERAQAEVTPDGGLLGSNPEADLAPPEPIGAEHYARTRAGQEDPSTLARLLLRRLLALCRRTAEAWRVLGRDRQRVLSRLDELAPPGEEESAAPLGHLAPASPERLGLEADERRLRALRRRVTIEMSRLRTTPRAARPDRVSGAKTRFGSRALARRLLEESRRCVRTDPEEAESFASLVPLVLARFLVPGGPAWAAVLAVRAEAHRANALRVAGDLPAAALAFASLRAAVGAQPVDDPATLAELASLEASLAIGQRRFDDAETLLERAIALYFAAEDGEGEGRALLKKGMLQRTRGRLPEALEALAAAARRLAEGELPYPLLGAVHERALCLCELERAAEAEALVARHLDLYEASDDPHVGAILRGLQGRIALGLGRLGEAEEAHASSRDALLSLGRTYDALLASLDLALVHLEAGDGDELERLSGELVGLFRSRDVPRETVAALRLLARAAAQRRATRDLVERLRRRVEAVRPPAR